ncbi:hypothetical protein AeNC1_003567 [Aphanomyces euteiches]|nr:hypothetical protein AeNC1_003567 [Aphanomyces euteiches]
MDAILHQPDIWTTILSFQDGVSPDIAQFTSELHDFKDFQHVQWHILGSRLAPHPAIHHIRLFDIPFSRFYKSHGIRGVVRLVSSKPNLYAILTAHAAYFGNMEVLNILCPSKWANHSNAFVQRVRRINMVAWSHSYRSISGSDTIEPLDLAAIQGHFKAVKLLYERGYPFSYHAIDGATEMGHLAIVKYLVEVCQIKCTTKTLSRARDRGHSEIVAYLMAHATINRLPADFNCACGNYRTAKTSGSFVSDDTCDCFCVIS